MAAYHMHWSSNGFSKTIASNASKFARHACVSVNPNAPDIGHNRQMPHKMCDASKHATNVPSKPVFMCIIQQQLQQYRTPGLPAPISQIVICGAMT